MDRMRPYYHAIAFDFDGTLVDTMNEYARIASEEISHTYGFPLSDAKRAYLQTSGIPFFQQLEVIFGIDERNPYCAHRYEGRKERFLQSVDLNEDTRGALIEIRKLGLSLAIASNNFQSLVERFMRREPHLFDLVLGFNEGLCKGPSQFGLILDTFGVDRRHMLFVGDSLSDLRKSLAFGLDFVAVSGTFTTEDFLGVFPPVSTIRTIRELPKMLKTGKPLNGGLDPK
jgi:phosphoglycolate phosphatase-like HAD superfamily hydrolase